MPLDIQAECSPNMNVQMHSLTFAATDLREVMILIPALSAILF